MPCYRINPDAIEENQLLIEGALAHHLIRVLRVTPGEALLCTDGGGTRWTARVARVAKDALTVTLGAQDTCTPPRIATTMAAAMLPQDRWKILIEKSVELGATTIQPLVTARTVVRAASAAKLQKWQKMVDAAAEQCGTVWTPVIRTPQSLAELLDGADEHTHCFMCHTGSGMDSRQSLSQRAGIQVVCIGPEGGFTDREVDQAMTAGAQFMSLGHLTLRAETAAIVALARLQHTE